MVSPETDVRYLKGVGEKRAAMLAKLGVGTIGDLLRTYPRGYIDFSSPAAIAEAPADEPCAVRAEVVAKSGAIRLSGGRLMFRAEARDDTGFLQITFFNNPYAVQKLNVGEEYVFYGRLGEGIGRREVTAPVFQPAGARAKLEAVYHLTGGLSSRKLSSLEEEALAQCGQMPDPLPAELRAERGLLPLGEALRSVHFPPSKDAAEDARRRFAYEELFCLELGMKLLRSRSRLCTGAPMRNCSPAAYYAGLPFRPTGAQLRAVDDMIRDFAGPAPMNRLLEGDVGSGKTMVAAAGMAMAADSGYQSVLMAPTEILARQHADTLDRLLRPLGRSVGLLTGSVRGAQRKALLARIAAGGVDVVVGTQAVLSGDVQFRRLGFAVADEQQRFGVRQRGLLAAKAESPHLLVMSATPIPRTLSLLLFGELDVSILDELPPGRKPVKTYAVGTDLRARMYGFLEKQIRAGRQVFVVCPLIEADEENTAAAEMQAVTTYRDEVAAKLLPGRRIGLLHGRMKPAEKTEVMRRFREGELDLLCSTTVVEVGVDVPNASVMVIENAERYGLSALHQLRGRVGRGADESWCILVSDSRSASVRDRLAFLSRTQDGFAVAQYDLEHRGPGDFFGKRQHGLPTLKAAQDLFDAKLVSAAAGDAGRVLAADPDLSSSANAALRAEVERLFSEAGGTAVN